MLISDTLPQQVPNSASNLEPLPHPITHIRLLEVLPSYGNNDTTISCRLKTVRLTEYDQCYTALSYTWSHAHSTKSIFVNGHEIQVQENLYRFLHIYREQLVLKSLPTVFLWVDALCLDYHNIRERNCQVQIMPSIFAKAKTVLAWLESFESNFDIARDAMQMFVEFLKDARTDLERPQNYHNDRYLITKYCSDGQVRAQPLAASRKWKMLLYFCQHHYWTRLWVLLENRFAQNLMYMHGDTLWTWAEFRAPFVLLWYLHEWAVDDNARLFNFDVGEVLDGPAGDVVKTRLSFAYKDSAASTSTYAAAASDRWHLVSERELLPDLLTAYQQRPCTDTVDKVYALVGMSNSTLTIDYGRSNIELFCAVLLDLKTPPELSFISMLAHHLGVGAFQHKQNRNSIIKNVPPTNASASTSDLLGSECRSVFYVKEIQARTEISDIMQARLGIQKLNYYRVRGQQNVEKMNHWDDFDATTAQDMAKLWGHMPGTSMPIVDGFDLSETSFRAAMFVNPASRRNRILFGMISTDYVQDGDIMVAAESMHFGIVIRLSGLSKTWLTVIGTVLFARKTFIDAEIDYGYPTSSIRSLTLSEFSENAQPTPFVVVGCEENNVFTLKPHAVQPGRSVTRNTLLSGRHSRNSSNSTSTTKSSTASPNKSKLKDDRRFTSKSERLERILEVIRPDFKRHSTR